MAAAAPLAEWTPVNGFYGPVHVALSWPDSHDWAGQSTVDLDLSAVAYTEDGQMLDACYFKKPSVLNNSIVSAGDAVGQEGVFVHVPNLPPNVKFVFFIVTCKSERVAHLGMSGAQVRFADGSQPGGRFIRAYPLSYDTTAVLAGVFVKGPSHLYPPSDLLQFLGVQNNAADFNEALVLVEHFLAENVDPNVLSRRPANDPTQTFDMSKKASYFLDPSIRNVTVGLGWQSGCDLDVHCYILDEWYQKLDHVYKGDRNYSGVQHSGDRDDGWAAHIDEAIVVNFDALPHEVKHIAFFICINQGEEYQETYRDAEGISHTVTKRHPPPPSFACINNCFAQMTSNTGVVLSHFPLAHDGEPGRTRLMVILSRFGPDSRWQMVPLGKACRLVSKTEQARDAIVKETRPDLLRHIKVTIGVLRASGVVAKDSKGTSDPFARIKFFDHDTTVKTKTIKKTLEPEWNEPSLLQWTGPIISLFGRVQAKIDVYDWDRLSFNDHMGRVYLHLRDVLGTRGRGLQERTVPLGQKHEGEDKEVTGTLTFVWSCEPAT